LTFKQVAERAVALCSMLRADDAPADPVAIYAPNSVGWYVWVWAIALSGQPMIPINPALTARETHELLANSGAGTVIAAREYRGRDLLHVVDGLAGELPAVRRIWDIDQFNATDSATMPQPAVHPSDTFVVQYTSGTTGTPKGAVLSHQTCVAAATWMLPALAPVDHEICCSALPLHHIGALIAHVLALACIGGTYVILDGFSAPEFLDAAAASRATQLVGVPTTYLRLLDDPTLAERSLPDVRVLTVGGATIPEALIARLEQRFDAPVSVMYGQTEAPAITQTRLDDPLWVKATTVGRAAPHRKIRIVDTSTGEPLAAGHVGEICVHTAIRMDRYHNMPEATLATIDRDGWLYTGDLGALDEQGRLRFHGRLRDMIVRGGENIYAREVEAAIESHPDVAQAAVVGLPDDEWGEIVAAVVVPCGDRSLDGTRLAAWVGPRLASYKRPVRWHVTDQLPTNAAGKPQKFKLIETLTSQYES
jgi:fatty-acyl-CoA synthase